MFFLIGHRGVGKTFLCKKLSGVDLDERINEIKPIENIFKEEGERAFRELEKKTLEKVLQKNPKWVALGAGFELDKFKFPEDARFIWLQRASDVEGRIFLNRPRLDKNTGALEEYFSRFEEREKLYEKVHHMTFEMEEFDFSDTLVRVLETLESVETHLPKENVYYTLKSNGDALFYTGPVELRTDWLSENEISRLIEQEKYSKIIVAIRKQPSKEFLDTLKNKESILIDVPTELIDLHKNFNNFFISSHEENINSQWVEEWNQKGVLIKWSPKIENFSELIEKYNLVKEKNVSFLPRSEKGRWRWLRILLLNKNQINFFRFGRGKYLDQPSYLDLFKKIGKYNGTVLGGDVTLSYSPGFHEKFFRKNFSSTYLRIKINQEELNQKTISFLKNFNVRFYSITAPLKEKIYEALGKTQGGACNTLVLKEKDFALYNTDNTAIESIAQNLTSCRKVVIWGSGAMGKQFKTVLGKKASLISVRKYQGEKLGSYEVLIWGAGKDKVTVPNLDWSKPPLILDLEYKENSFARSLALEKGSKYISGISFFKIQALKQQELWLKTLGQK